jgi:hypothetical protein
VALVPGAPPPAITSIDPDIKMIGSNNFDITINGSGFMPAPTVNLPQGFTSSGQVSGDARIVVTASITPGASIGTNNSVSVTTNEVSGNAVPFTVDGPASMVVISDSVGTCDGCSTTVKRLVTYEIRNVSDTVAASIPICEAPAISNWSCQQQNSGVGYRHCDSPYVVDSNGRFTDGWSMGSDQYTPSGCGFDTVDPWMWAASPSAQKTFATLSGFVHTNSVKINGVENPPDSFAVDTRIAP